MLANARLTMGLFDWRKKKMAPVTPVTPVPEASKSPPPVGPARIASFELGDGVGKLDLDGGHTLRFGRSACRGFEPVAGVRVLVRELSPHPLGGFRATVLELDDSDGTYDARLAERDAAAGLPSRETDAADAAGTVALLGWVTVLLDEPVPPGPMALRAWTARMGLDAAGIRVGVSGGLEFQCDGRSIQAVAGNQPLPRGGLDLREVPSGFDLGRAFIGLNLGLTDLEYRSRIMRGDHYPHPFAVGGSMRALSRLVAALLGHGTGVVLNRAGQWVLDRDTFLLRLGDLDDPHCMPWGAWVGFAIDHQRGGYASFGMEVFALRDVAVSTEAGNRWSESRGFEAINRACGVMVRENRELAAGEILEVPLGYRGGAHPAPDPHGACVAYRVDHANDFLRLQREQPAIDEPAAWLAAAGPGELPPNLYQVLFDAAVQRALPGETLEAFPSGSDRAPPHLLVMRRAEHGGVWVFTNGFGRVVQPGGAASDVPHVEFLTCLPRASFDEAAIIGRLASAAFERGPRETAYKVFDRLRAPIPELHIGGFLIDDGGTVKLGAGRSAQLLALVPATVAEYADAVVLGTEVWLAQNLGSTHRLAKIAARWQLAAS